MSDIFHTTIDILLEIIGKKKDLKKLRASEEELQEKLLTIVRKLSHIVYVTVRDDWLTCSLDAQRKEKISFVDRVDMMNGVRKELFKLQCAIDRKNSEISCNFSKFVYSYTQMAILFPPEEVERFADILREHLPELAEALVLPVALAHEIDSRIWLEHCDVDTWCIVIVTWKKLRQFIFD